MRFISTNIILLIISAFFFIANSIIMLILLGMFNLVHDPISVAWLHIGLTIFTSVSLYLIAFGTTTYFSKDMNPQQFFFTASIYVYSCIPILRLTIKRFQNSIPENLLILLARVFSFVYITMVLFLVVSFIMVNVQQNKNITILMLIILFSAMIAKEGPISYSKAISEYEVFVGGKWFIPLGGFSLCIIALLTYCVNLIKLAIPFRLIITQATLISIYLLSLHIIIIFPFVLLLSASTLSILLLSLVLYVRRIFINFF